MREVSMGKTYSPGEFEKRIYGEWMEKGHFEANVNKDKKPYTIMLPPPNITGQLHMGHALDQTLQDILIRWKRMEGYEALWLPGTDHASIATEVKVVEKIREEENKSKEDIGRDEFLKRAWKWRDEYGRRIVTQMQSLGSSCDWSKERFTMDEGCNEAVTEVFVRLYEKGLIYRGNRLINWCPDCMTTLSDAEVEHEEKDGKFYHIKYFITGSDSDYLEIATTRPETMLGDTAVAVNPNDDRYKSYIGKTVTLPLMNREIPVIGDDYVDMELGTGALKVTPAHDPNDFEIGKRHNLPQITVMNENATINEHGGKYSGMDRYECRKALMADLKDGGYLVDVKDHSHNVGTCYRCDTVIEPRLSDQWFVKMEELAKPAMDAISEEDLRFVPDRFEKIYTHWLENIRDWCISRQLWWGHRIPAWYCDSCGEIIVSRTAPEKCSCGSSDLRRDEDVLDTWFSSALWPFSTLGWPNKTEELDYFYPTDVLVTGYDIIFFWVVRMVFSGIEQMGKVPFHTVLIHGLIRAADGQKMSKSLGNGVDPLDVIDDYGADALRFMLATGNSPGNDMRYSKERVEACRNFANKLWNASRFVLMNLDSDEYDESFFVLDGSERLELADKWILSRMNGLAGEVTHNMEKFETGIAASKVYEFVWNEYCDWYIELTKKRLNGTDEKERETAQKVLVIVLKDILKLLHPFMPFITEEIWAFIPGNKTDIIVSSWPVRDDKLVDGRSESDMESVIAAIKSLRNLRAEMEVAPSRKARLVVAGSAEVEKLYGENREYFMTAGSCSDVSFAQKSDIVEDVVSTVVEGAELFLPLDDLVDYNKELERLEKELKKLSGEVARVSGKLSNEGFVAKAPQKLIDEEKEKLEKYQNMLDNVEERLKFVKAKLG